MLMAVSGGVLTKRRTGISAAWAVMAYGSDVGGRLFMGIGASLVLITFGAILAFATDLAVSGIDLNMVGVILMIMGVVGLVLTLVVWGPRRRAVAGREVVEERRVYDEGSPF